MALPLGSSDARAPTSALPVITVGLVVACVLVFLYALSLSEPQLHRATSAFSLVPCEITNQCALSEGTPNPPLITLVTSMFMHGSWEHLLGNMLFLLVFGIAVERAMGAGHYLAFYLLAGLGGSALHIVTATGSDVPLIGASGAIAGVLAGYLVLYPTSHIDALVPLGPFGWIARIPAWLFIGGWFLFQLIVGLDTLGDAGVGVAYSAHVGGFIAGLLLVRRFS